MGHRGLESQESLRALPGPSVILRQEKHCEDQLKDASDMGSIDMLVDDIICTFSHI